MKRAFITMISLSMLLIGSAGNALGEDVSTKAAAAPAVAEAHGAPTSPPSGIAPLSAANKIVQGAGVPTDDLGDEGTLCNGCSYWASNYAGFWQAILWADGYLSAGQVDCEFGSITANATKSWQSRFGLSSDGVVGANTRGKADDFLATSSDPNYNLYYIGFDYTLYLWRDTTSPYNYHIWWNGAWSLVSYTTKSMSGC